MRKTLLFAVARETLGQCVGEGSYTGSGGECLCRDGFVLEGNACRVRQSSRFFTMEEPLLVEFHQNFLDFQIRSFFSKNSWPTRVDQQVYLFFTIFKIQYLF